MEKWTCVLKVWKTPSEATRSIQGKVKGITTNTLEAAYYAVHSISYSSDSSTRPNTMTRWEAKCCFQPLWPLFLNLFNVPFLPLANMFSSNDSQQFKCHAKPPEASDIFGPSAPSQYQTGQTGQLANQQELIRRHVWGPHLHHWSHLIHCLPDFHYLLPCNPLAIQFVEINHLGILTFTPCTFSFPGSKSVQAHKTQHIKCVYHIYIYMIKLIIWPYKCQPMLPFFSIPWFHSLCQPLSKSEPHLHIHLSGFG